MGGQTSNKVAVFKFTTQPEEGTRIFCEIVAPHDHMIMSIKETVGTRHQRILNCYS
jgi:hypothetical protein